MGLHLFSLVSFDRFLCSTELINCISIYICALCRYEKELIHPIQNLFSGELARAMLIQVLSCFPVFWVQSLKLSVLLTFIFENFRFKSLNWTLNRKLN